MTESKCNQLNFQFWSAHRSKLLIFVVFQSDEIIAAIIPAVYGPHLVSRFAGIPLCLFDFLPCFPVNPSLYRQRDRRQNKLFLKKGQVLGRNSVLE